MSMEDEMFHKSFPIINQNPMTIVDKTLLIDSVLKVQSGQIMDAYPSYYFIPEQPMVCNNHITSHENMMNRPMLPSSFPESTNNGTCNSLSSYYVVGSSESGRFLDQTFMYHMPTDQVPHKFTEVNYSGLTEITCQESRNSDITGKTTAFPQVLHISDHSGLESSHGNVREIEFPEVCFSKTLLGSKYLNVAQQILVQIARCGLEDQKEKDHQLPDITKNKPCLSFSCPSYQGDDHETLICCNFKSKKAALSSLMQMIDQRYNHCIAQMNKVMAAFHDATENSDVQMLSWFAFQMVSVSYKNMRDKISTEIHSSSEQLISKNNTGENTTVESSHFQNGMVRRNEQQSWRPQRGLPEKSVSILKEWMFQNFLHPYPNDAVKHFLAIKSGLTRNQVSNWFINARVRIWKPMIEEMYMEYNRKLRTDRLVAI